MFIPHSSLEHQEKKLFALTEFMKFTMPRFVSGFPQFFLSSNLIKQKSFYVFEEKRLHKPYQKNFCAKVHKINNHYKSVHHLEVIVQFSWVLVMSLLWINILISLGCKINKLSMFASWLRCYMDEKTFLLFFYIHF